MKRGYLSQYFESVAAKQLSAVEADTHRSNQHEFNGTKELKKVLGDCNEDKKFKAIFLWFGSENEGISSEGFVTWYDSRRNQPHRSAECRLYFPTTDASSLWREGDMMFIAKRTDETVMIIVTSSGTTIEKQLFWLFDLQNQSGTLFEYSAIEDDTDLEIDFPVRFILDELQIEIEEPEADRLDQLLERFGGILPSTSEFSSFARSSLQGIDSLGDPDTALMAWMNHEEKLFRRLERHIVSQRIKEGFIDQEDSADVEGFIKFSLSVQNRRKARVGFALEHHMEEIFKNHKVQYQKGARTEAKKKPDFLFPGSKEYSAPDFPSSSLSMLGVKTTLKERWRQILSEANRIPVKHLLTLEPGISENQTEEMKSFSLQLVVPQVIHETFSATQTAWLMNVTEFISTIKSKQK